MSEAPEAKPLLTLPVKFGSVSVTDHALAIGFSTPREGLTPQIMEDALIDRLIECRLTCDLLAGGDAPGQQTMGISDVVLGAVCGSTSFRTSAKQYSGRLIFSSDCDALRLMRFIKQTGVITILTATPREQVGG